MRSRRSQGLDRRRRRAAKRWLTNWKQIGRTLDAERWGRLRALTRQRRAAMTLDLLGLWRPELPGDDADALLRTQRAFALWRKTHA